MEYKTIIFEKNANYAKIILNRPDKLNALNQELFSELNEAIAFIESQSDIRALIITGSGEKAFAAGADIIELNNCDEKTGVLFSEFGSNVMRRIELLKIPVIAAVNGFALGGGCELAMCCHIRFASDNAKFGQPEVNLGIIPGYGGTQRLTKLVGLSKSLELNLSGNIIDANEAFRIGLINQIFSKGELMDKTLEFVDLLMSKSSNSLANILDTVYKSLELNIDEGLKYESSKFGETCGSENFKEGTLAFIEKRKPNFK